MKQIISSVAIAALFFCISMSRLAAQGNDFWFVAPHMSEFVVAGKPLDEPAFLAITNMDDKPAQVQITLYNGGSPIIIDLTINAGEFYKYDFNNQAKMKQIENPRGQAGNVTKYGMHITSTAQLVVYYMHNHTDSRDIFTLKGERALGMSFYVPMQSDNNFPNQGNNYPGACDQIDIVATEDNTTVEVVPKAPIRIGASGSSAANYKITRILQKGETLKIMENAFDGASLAGTSINATSPVAVTVTEDLVSGDTSGDQIVPVSSLGTRYVIAKGYMTNSDNERVYMIATQNGTNISVNGSSIATNMAAGNAVVYTIPSGSNAVYVESNYPIYVYQRTGHNEQGSALLPSIYAINNNRISFYVVEAQNEKAFILFRTGTQSSFTITYNNVTSSLNVGTPIASGLTGWSVARFDLPAATKEKVVTIHNPQSSFAFGYIAANTDRNNMSSFGFLRLDASRRQQKVRCFFCNSRYGTLHTHR
ncbi:MAG: IgGFc-binding protein [Dysgonamonadaceae bacterium]|jgi:hypothetical protein|nr:IgGFc-binding protein [Dysgonamonadaceae bacterium]